MLKRLILLTVPHSGTHTWFRLLYYVRCLPAWWGHFEPRGWGYIEQALRNNDTLYVVAERPIHELTESYKKRAPKKGLSEKDAVGYLDQCLDVQDKFFDIVDPRLVVTVPTLGDFVTRRNKSEYIFARFGQHIDAASEAFLHEWPALNAYEPDPNARNKYDLFMHRRHIDQMED